MNVNNNLNGNFELLRNIIRPVSSVKMKADISRVNEIINDRLVSTVKEIAPPDFHVLYGDFKAEYDQFKDFILYDRLIGKNIVALGGAFSSGKSSFLNAIMGHPVLPADIDPSTSVPTFIVKGEAHYLSGINVFDATLEISDVLMIRQIAHGFGRAIDNDLAPPTDVVTLGHIIDSLFFSTPFHAYEHLAFLDTPGYSKPESADYSARTDEQIARRQLNTANGILWFLQADGGTITENDITFIRSLNETTPKLFVLTKADKKPAKEIEEIIRKIKATLALKGVQYVDVLAYSCNDPKGYDSKAIIKWLEKWNAPNSKNNFAANFKKLFVRCFDYYDEEIETEGRQLKGLNKALTLSDDPDVGESLQHIVKISKATLGRLETVRQSLKELQTEFFAEIKMIGDIVGIPMPEPSELDLIGDAVTNPLEVLNAYVKKKGIKRNNGYQNMMKDAFKGVKPLINSMQGGSEYKNSLMKTLSSLNRFEKPFSFARDLGGMDYQTSIVKALSTLNSPEKPFSLGEKRGGIDYQTSLMKTLSSLNRFEKPFSFARDLGGMDYQTEVAKIIKTLDSVENKQRGPAQRS